VINNNKPKGCKKMKTPSARLPKPNYYRPTPVHLRNQIDNIFCRLRDIILSGFVLVILTPLYAWIGIVIKRDSAGSVFYRGERIGINGKPFKMLKFRTMVESAGANNGPLITGAGDSRITSVGKWLRDTKINELPQLWNVFIGEMSLVGPRPEDPTIVTLWPENVRDEILSVRPGVTSPASVLYRDEERQLCQDNLIPDYIERIMPGKLRLDLRYVRSRSGLMDLDILFWTLLVLIPAIGQVQPPEDVLFWGPFTRFVQANFNWVAIDGIVTFLAFIIASFLLRLVQPLDVGWLRLLKCSLGFTALATLAGSLLGTQKIYWSKALAADAIRLIPVSGLVLGISLILNFVLDLMPQVLLALASGLTFLGFILVRYRSRLFTGPAYHLLSRHATPKVARERVLIVGSGDTGQAIAYMISHSERKKCYQVVGYADDDYRKTGIRIAGAKVLGKCGNIPVLVEQLDIGIIIFAIHNISPEKKADLLTMCNDTLARVVEMPNILGQIETVSNIMQNIYSMEARVNGK
jgi:lipopolysaccharide/colanic/teichoic acid biosynthesis glycosyltransferase